MVFPDTDLDVMVEAYLGANRNDPPGSWPAPTDLSSRLLRREISIRRGRGKNQKTASAGACTLWLDNTDGALTPLLATSPYYPHWDMGVPLRVSVDNIGNSPPYVRHAGFVADISMVMIPGTNGENFSVVKVTSAGVLRRLSQGAVAKSPMRRFYENVSPQPVAYWPLESGDERSAFRFQSGLAGGSDLVVTQSTAFGVTRPFAAAGGVSPGPPGAASATDTSSGGFLRGAVPNITTATMARGEIALLANGFENTLAPFVSLRHTAVASDGGESRLGVSAQEIAGEWRVGVTWIGPASGGNSYAAAANSPLMQDNQWHHVQLDISSAGGGADTAFTVRVDGEVIVTGTATGYTWTPPTIVSTNALATDVDRLCHFAVWSGTSLPAAADSYDAFLAHPGEQAHVRFARLCAEEGIPYSGTATQSVECGRQPVGDIVALLQDAEAVDHGMLIEDFGWGFNYRASSQRENLSPAFTVDLSTYRTTEGTQADVLTPVRNDARIRNEWTITSPSGMSATASDPVQIAEHGRYNDSASVNVQDDRLLDEAGWRLREGTRDGLAYNTVPLDLAANE